MTLRLFYTTILFSLLFLFVLPFTAFAGADDRFKGWAWSPNIGWISFNCTNTDYCETVDYGVTIALNNTDVSGWAWSPNIGWIDFSGATFNSATGIISGIGNAVAGDVENDGWNGDIVLYDDAPIAYGADVQSDNEVDGYAWGGVVVGWLSFNCENSGTCGTVDYFVEVEPFYFNFTANAGLTTSDRVPYNGNVSLSWTTSGAVSCTASGAPTTNWATPPTKSAGEPSPGGQVIPALTADVTFTLTCQDSLARTIARDLTIYVSPPAPEVTMTADDNNIPYNTGTTINWDALFVASCTKSGQWGTGSAPVGVGQSEATGNLTNIDNFFNLTCTSSDTVTYPDPIFEQVLVNVEKLTLDLALDTDNVPFADPTVLNWTATFATSGECTASGGAGTTWASSPSKTAVTDVPNSQIIYKAGTTEPLDPGNYSFTLSCTGSSGQTIEQTSILKVGRNPNFSEELGTQ